MDEQAKPLSAPARAIHLWHKTHTVLPTQPPTDQASNFHLPRPVLPPAPFRTSPPSPSGPTWHSQSTGSHAAPTPVSAIGLTKLQQTQIPAIASITPQVPATSAKDPFGIYRAVYLVYIM
ncbi:hypothetical protein FRC12_003399 [Ceratobasidium sp. 428]|nr:hypothetical protein FRC12_003399 [Ceratobasidium sp. 428]